MVCRVHEDRVVELAVCRNPVVDVADPLVDLADHSPVAAPPVGQPFWRCLVVPGRGLRRVPVKVHVGGRGLDWRVWARETDVEEVGAGTVTRLEPAQRARADECGLLVLVLQRPLVRDKAGVTPALLVHKVMPVLVVFQHVVETVLSSQVFAVVALEPLPQHPVARYLTRVVPAKRVHEGTVGFRGVVGIIRVDAHVRLADDGCSVTGATELADEGGCVGREFVEIREATCVHPIAARGDCRAGG